jgi:hypothetical protein
MPESASSPSLDLVPKRSRRWRLILAALTVMMWGCFLVFPSAVASDELDLSWMHSLGHFYHTGAQAGTDYVFTYGPLGTFATWTYDPDTYWQRYLWELAVKLALAVVITGSLAALPQRGLTLLGATLLIALVPCHFDTIYEVGLLALGVQLLDGVCRGRPWAALLVPLLAALALTKFTYFVLALWSVALAEVAGRLKGCRWWLSPALLYLAALIAVWLLCGQRLLHLGAYCRNSWEIASGYEEALSVPSAAFDPILLLAAAALSLALVLLVLSVWQNRRSVFHVTAALLLGPGLLLGWKHGLVRSADDHPLIFFGMALFAGFVLPRLLAPRTSLLTWLTLGCLWGCCVAGSLLTAGGMRPPNLYQWSVERMKANLEAALSPLQTKQKLAEQRQHLARQWRLDRVREEVGDGAVDQLSCQQGIVLLNGLNWRPRPVFQSYTAYTPALLRLNADYFRSNAAPDYLLMNLAPVDDRLGAMEDAPALLEILRRYYPILRERQFVLFKRIPLDESNMEPKAEVVARRTIHFQEEVQLNDLPGEYQLLALRFQPSAGGLLRGLFYKRHSLFLELRTASQTLRRRVIPAMATEGFLINPLVDTTADFVGLYRPSGGDRVVSCRILSAGQDFQDNVELTVTALPRLPCRTLKAEEVKALVSHGIRREDASPAVHRQADAGDKIVVEKEQHRRSDVLRPTLALHQRGLDGLPAHRLR